MKNIVFGLLILFTGCVSIETYETDIKKVEDERDRYKLESLYLKVDYEILKGFLKYSGIYVKELESKLKDCENKK